VPATHSPDELQRLYERRFRAREDYRDRVWHVLAAWFGRFVPRTSTVLDLGCGHGEFIRHVAAERRLAMDLNPDVERLAGHGVEVLNHDCSQPWPLDDGSLDVVFSSNFFEHLASKDDLRRTVTEARRCLRPGGRLVALGPNVRLVPGAYWDFYDHHLPLTERSLGELLQDCGFDIRQSWAAFLPYTMSEGRPRFAWMLPLYLRLPLMWRLFGKQFLIVAELPQPLL
jgi:SAM-dependent methyltransferase